jgi:hypothetical protein
VPNSRRLRSERRSCRCKSCHPDHFLRCRLISRTAGFELVNGGASPPAAANDFPELGTARRGRLTEGRKSGGCDTRRLHHFPLSGPQALTVKPLSLKQQNSEHYRGDPPLCFVVASRAASLSRFVGITPLRAPASWRPVCTAHDLSVFMARWRSQKRSSLIRRRSRVRIPPEPHLSSARRPPARVRFAGLASRQAATSWRPTVAVRFLAIEA